MPPQWVMLLGFKMVVATAALSCVSVPVIPQVQHTHSSKNCTPQTTQSRSVLFSITTTLHIPEKHIFVEEALDSFVTHHPDHSFVVGRWLLINEYSDNNQEEVAVKLRHLKNKFPFLDAVQKSAQDQGQPESLNIILHELRAGNFSYWLHIEESWRTIRPFLQSSLKFLDEHLYLQQLQLYQAAYYTSHTHIQITEDIKVIALDSYIALNDVDPRDWRAYSLRWPSYSLRPSITRVNFLKASPDLTFNTDPAWFPVIFEFDFSIKWQLMGGSMCAVTRDAVVRQEGHRSTYVL